MPRAQMVVEGERWRIGPCWRWEGEGRAVASEPLGREGEGGEWEVGWARGKGLGRLGCFPFFFLEFEFWDGNFRRES